MIRLLTRLRDNIRGLALLEFAFTLPILLTLTLAGAELTNFITVKMRVSQLALWVADNAARITTSSALPAKTITEGDINDLFAGAKLQSRELDIDTNGRIILSSLEPMANPNTTSKYKIRWQRCTGKKVFASKYGLGGATNLTGMGPAGRQVTAQDNNATMFVEIYYEYKPLIPVTFAPVFRLRDLAQLDEIASMAVRDRRDLESGIKAGGTAATC